jgi:hypothetical protein
MRRKQLNTIRDRLENWAEAAWWGIGGRSGRSIGSAEGRYRSNPREDEEAPLRRIRPEPDWEDAELVDAAWKTMAPKYKWLLKFLYIDNAPIPFICRRVKIKPNPRSLFELERVRAEAELERRLVNAEKPAHNEKNLIPEFSE